MTPDSDSQQDTPEMKRIEALERQVATLEQAVRRLTQAVARGSRHVADVQGIVGPVR